jgi:hypothetical protein
MTSVPVNDVEYFQRTWSISKERRVALKDVECLQRTPSTWKEEEYPKMT